MFVDFIGAVGVGDVADAVLELIHKRGATRNRRTKEVLAQDLVEAGHRTRRCSKNTSQLTRSELFRLRCLQGR